MLLYFAFQSFVIVSDLEHKVLENLMRCTSLLLRIHHVKQIFIIFIFRNKLSPFRFITDFFIKKFLLQEISKIDAIVSFTKSFFFECFFFMFFFSLHDVLTKNSDSFIWMKIFIWVIISKFRAKIIPFHVVFNVLVLH